MRTDSSITQTASFPAVTSVLSRLASEDEYYVSELNVHRVASPTITTDTTVFASRLWGEDQGQYAIVAGTKAVYTPVFVRPHEFDIDIVFTGAANSGIPTTTMQLPHFVVTSQAVSETLLSADMLVARLAIETSVSGPLQTLFRGVNHLSDHYGALLENGVIREKLSSRTAEWFARTLKQMVRTEPVVDGYDHPAEAFLQDTFEREPDVARQWFLSALRENLPPPLVADSLRLLGRFTFAGKEWRARIAAEGLRSPWAEVRDAAMQAIESWGDPELVSVLKDYREREPRKWLREYADQIIQDLTE